MPSVSRTILLVFAVTAAFSAANAGASGSLAIASHPYGGPLFSTIGAEDGLPNTSVSSIAQDAQGFLWFGTQGGIARYDGHSFKLFSHEPFDTGSLTLDLVQCLFLDGDRLWAGTYGGLACLDLKTEKFRSYSYDPSKADSLSNDIVTCVARDSRGALWVGTLSGLNRLDEATGSFTRFRHSPSDPASLPADAIRAIKPDREGRLWIGTSGGALARYDYANGGFEAFGKRGEAGRGGAANVAALPSDVVMAIDQDPSGRLWVATWGGGLSLFDPVTRRFENHPTSDGRAYSLCASEDGTVYVGTWGGGLYEYSTASGRFENYRSTGSLGSLSNDVVYSLLRDSSGELWIGTNGGGISKLGSERRGFEVISAAAEGMPSGKVYAAFIDRRGFLWVGVYNKGIARRDPASGAWRRFRHRDGAPSSLPNDIVNFIREDDRGTLWVGTNGGLARFDPGSDSFRTVDAGVAGLDSLASERIYAMVDDPSGGEWIGTFSSGLVHWNRESGAIERFPHFPDRPESLSDDMVTALCLDGTGRLWVGTNKGLNRLGDRGGAGDRGSRFAHYFYDPRKPGGVSSDSIRTIFLDSGKVLWIGTSGGGLMRYESETDSFVSYTKEDGLPSNAVLKILEDRGGSLWVATQTGLAQYNRVSGRFRGLWVESDDLSTEFFPGAFAVSDGTLLFGALDRIYRFDPASFTFNDHRPPVALCSVSVAGRPTLGPGALASIGHLDVDWRRNSVSFEFAALDYRDPSRNRYSYRLVGFDEDWSPSGPGHLATYTNLPGGNYVFRVRASNNDGLWNEEGLALPLHVSTAPWSSPWAFVLYAILCAGGGFLAATAVFRTSLASLRSEVDSLRRKLIAASASMESAAIVDSLTGLPNRRKAEEHLQLALTRAATGKLDLAVLMVDIDRFKSYNDRFGKVAGNECLRRVAEALQACVRRSSDVVARYGGEEFLVVLEETSLEGALREAEAVRRAVEALAISRGEGANSGQLGGFLTVSVGCASIQPDPGYSPALLIADAEKAVMAAKMLGRNRTST